MYKLDFLIINQFGLFKGFRPTEEDQKIFDMVYWACFEEIILFIQEELDPSRKNFLNFELEKVLKEYPDDEKVRAEKGTEVVFKYFTAIPHYRYKLNKRLEYLIDKIYVEAIKGQSQGNFRG